MHVLRSFKKKTKIIILFAVAAVVIAAAAVLLPHAQAFFSKTNGVDLKPAHDIAFDLPTIYQQTDPAYADQTIDDSDYKMSSHGCLVCAISNVLNINGQEISPSQLNKAFSEYGVYDNDANVIWYKIKDAIGYDYHYSRVFSSETMMEDLEQGRYPIVKVKYHQTGIFHWVLIVGAKDNEFYIADSLHEGKAIPLSTHGKVYAYRVLYKAEE